MSDADVFRYCGRDFTAMQLEQIRNIITEWPSANRAQLSRIVCAELDWKRPDGRLKDMSCRVAMLRMQKDGLLSLPPPTKRNGNGQRYQRRTPQAEPELFQVIAPVNELAGLHLVMVQGKCDRSHLWNEFIDRYHYLGYKPLPGAQIRYFAQTDEGQILALLGFGAAAWKAADRDSYIGWCATKRKANLHLIVNNSRFLILPWVRSPNLASSLLGMCARRLADDWEQNYSYRPVLLETFVETPRFRGTCYKAANWLCVGETKGRGKLDRHHEAKLPRKTIWLLPLVKDFRSRLQG